MNLTSQIKKLLKEENVKNSVKTYGSTTTVTIKSEISQALSDKVKSLATVEAFGSIIDDTRYYTGQSIQMDYRYEATSAQLEKAAELYNYWGEQTKKDARVFAYHFKKQLQEKMGPTGLVIASTVYRLY